MVRLKLQNRPAAAAPLDIGELYRAHAPTVARWATRLGGPAVDAEDVVHEVFWLPTGGCVSSVPTPSRRPGCSAPRI